MGGSITAGAGANSRDEDPLGQGVDNGTFKEDGDLPKAGIKLVIYRLLINYVDYDFNFFYEIFINLNKNYKHVNIYVY